MLIGAELFIGTVAVATHPKAVPIGTRIGPRHKKVHGIGEVIAMRLGSGT